MVYHLPYTAAHQVVILVDFLPVSFRVAGAYAHGMRVFAHKVRTIVKSCLSPCMLTDVMDHLDARIHLTADIIGNSLAVDRALIVNRKVRVCFEEFIHGIRIVVAAGFVSERPHDNRCIGMNLVALI